MLAILVGFMVCAWLTTVGIGGFVAWRFKALWEVLRKDIVALNEAQGVLRKEIGLRKAMSVNDADLARAERTARFHTRGWGPEPDEYEDAP